MVELLLTHGADVDAVSINGNWTALHRACSAQDQEMSLLLIRHGADLYSKSAVGRIPGVPVTPLEHISPHLRQVLIDAFKACRDK